MKFDVMKAEAIYTGGGIYVYCGMTMDGQHFIADDDYWVMLTDKPTMTDELSDDDWNDMFYWEWMEANMTYQTQSEEEGREWIRRIYDWLIANTGADNEIKRRRAEMEE